MVKLKLKNSFGTTDLPKTIIRKLYFSFSLLEYGIDVTVRYRFDLNWSKVDFKI